MKTLPYRDLAAQCRDASTGDRILEGEIFRSLNAGSSPDDRWSDNFGDDVWHRESDERGAWEGPPSYFTDLTVITDSLPKGARFMSVTNRELGDAAPSDARKWMATVSVATSAERMGRVFTGEGRETGCAMMAAILLAHAWNVGEPDRRASPQSDRRD